MQSPDSSNLLSDNDESKNQHTHRKVPIKKTLKATNGKEIASSVVFIAALKHLQKEAKKYLKRSPLTEDQFETLKDSGMCLNFINYDTCFR